MDAGTPTTTTIIMLRPLSYYYYRRQVIKEIETMSYVPKPFVPLLMELKQVLKTKSIPNIPKVYDIAYIEKQKFNKIDLCRLPNDPSYYVLRKKRTPDRYIRIRIPRPYHFVKHYQGRISPCNMKKWDKTTKKTSSKGLKATHYWDKDKCTFWSHLTADEVENYALENGFQKQKGKKYYYGDYAQWLWHTLC